MDPISLCALVLLTFFGFAASQNTVANLPGFEGDLPFKLETGYVGVGESNEIQLFYYFVESHRSPTKDPLMIWQSGGPGASAQTALFYEHGPLGFTIADYKGSLPSLHLNPYALTQRVNILYVDVPVGTGFSYSTTQEGYYTDDLKSAVDTTQFIRKDRIDDIHKVWVNDKSVQKALNVREGTIGVFERVNKTIVLRTYRMNVPSTVEYHRNLSNTTLRALVYSGDHDMLIPHIGTQNWIRSLNLKASEIWRAWFVDGQVAGYTEKFTNHNFSLAFATVKGAGHLAPEYKPRECYEMIDRWLADHPL